MKKLILGFCILFLASCSQVELNYFNHISKHGEIMFYPFSEYGAALKVAEMFCEDGIYVVDISRWIPDHNGRRFYKLTWYCKDK